MSALSRSLKTAMESSADKLDLRAYFQRLYIENPDAFRQLLKRLMKSDMRKSGQR